jgi:hypothetical protein
MERHQHPSRPRRSDTSTRESSCMGIIVFGVFGENYIMVFNKKTRVATITSIQILSLANSKSQFLVSHFAHIFLTLCQTLFFRVKSLKTHCLKTRLGKDVLNLGSAVFMVIFPLPRAM